MQDPWWTKRLKNLILIFGAAGLFSGLPLSAQKLKEEKADTLRVKAGLLVILRDTFFVADRDTTIRTEGRNIILREDPYARSRNFYDSLAVRAGRNRMMKELYRLFVRDNNPVLRTAKNDKPRETYFNSFNGKIVRKIHTVRIPIIDGDVNDTAWKASTPLGSLLNWHPQTKRKMLKGAGIVKEGGQVQGTELADMERLVRELQTIRDARLYVLPVAGSDSIDVLMAAQDVFPLRINADYRSPDQFNVRLTDRNITGSADEGGIAFEHNTTLAGNDAYRVSLRQSNLFNRFFQGNIYAIYRGRRTEQAVDFGRNFLTRAFPDAGGLFFRNTKDRVLPDSGASSYHQYNAGAWYGRSFETSQNWMLIPALSYELKRCTELPENQYPFLRENKQALAAFTLLKRQFLRSALVKVFGTSEYIPVGFKVSIQGGIDYSRYNNQQDLFNRKYFSGNIDFAAFINDAGYFAVRLLSSTFIRDDRDEDRIRVLTGNYYTPLLRLGRVRIRQFADGAYREIKRPFSTALFNVKGPWEDSTGIIPGGNKMYSFGLRTVFFMPWYVYGFRFSVYDGADFNWIKNDVAAKGSFTYLPAIRAGIRIQNDFLTYSAFSFQAEWYPSVEGYKTYFEVSLRSFILPLFQGLQVGQPTVFSGIEK